MANKSNGAKVKWSKWFLANKKGDAVKEQIVVNDTEYKIRKNLHDIEFYSKQIKESWCAKSLVI